MESFRFIVYGKVQGVYFRKFVAQGLKQLGIQGYVRNQPDGSVEVVVRSHDGQIEAIESVLRSGSPLSKTERIEMERLEEGDDIVYDGFEIR